MIFYWWTWDVFKNLADIPEMAIHFLLGSFLAICGAWFCNIWFKISMHAIAMGSALMFFFLFTFSDSYASGLYLSIVLLATGLACVPRASSSPIIPRFPYLVRPLYRRSVWSPVGCVAVLICARAIAVRGFSLCR